MPKYAMYINIKRCIGCYACVIGCKNWHEEHTNTGDKIRVIDIIEGEYPNIMRWMFPVLCMQCENAPCIDICPEEAIYKRKDNIIAIDKDKCIGCGECVDACPYEAIYISEEEKAKKCDFCVDRIEKGLNPFCVEICPVDVFIFGDLENPENKISNIISSKDVVTLLSDKKTKPLVFYTNFPELSKIAFLNLNKNQ